MNHPAAPLPRSASSLGVLSRLLRDPNAIWMREMRQAARLGHTPWILFSVTLAVSLLMCTIGGIASTSHTSPANIGQALFQVFFSIAYLVVVTVGPAVAANGIASEREGRTWEAVILTGLRPKEIARGKFFAAYTTLALYIVVLAPVGALSFLFGGVTASEVVIAFAFLFLLAWLAVAFGLAVSSLMSSLRGAIVVTLMLAICVAPLLYFLFGFAASFGLHRLWPEVPEGYPVWLPLAVTRAPFGLEYVLFLVVVPVLLVIVPAWFLYEVTVANLTSGADDRSTGLKVWFFACTPLLALACAAPGLGAHDIEGRMVLTNTGLLAFYVHLLFSALLFASEPAAPSRRVRVHWARANVGAIRRFFGPGLSNTAFLTIAVGIAGLVGIVLVGVVGLFVLAPTAASTRMRAEQIVVFAVYLIPFWVFVVGLVAWLRARGNGAWLARIVACAILFFVFAGPWIVAAIGMMAQTFGSDGWIVVGAPSPIYAFYMVRVLDPTSSGASLRAAGPVLEIGVGCAVGWGILGLALVLDAARRAARARRAHDAAVAQAEAALAAEGSAEGGR